MNISKDIKGMKMSMGSEWILPAVNEVWEHGMKLAGAGKLNG